jgi:hypothetical protein
MKRGTLYEHVVAKVLKSMDPGASVERGVWVEGPDGRRELDVFISGMTDGRHRRVLVECKDFDPKTSGPIGIAYVDALESKRRDLDVDVSLICSNAGFTADAASKARRVGIGLMAVMKKGDRRIRIAVTINRLRNPGLANTSLTLCVGDDHEAGGEVSGLAQAEGETDRIEFREALVQDDEFAAL